MGSSGNNHHVVVDISSEEEVESCADVDYFSWLSEVMDAVDEKSDSTDVVEFVSEVKGGVDSQYRKSNSSIQDDDDDDDCVILEGDPDKTAIDDDDKELAKNNDDDDEDDVLVVGQKGEIACRDFPHPRHSCAKYPFNSTSHDKYCDMCHCYVCDTRAPCAYWCVGVSTMDHCHANDKEKVWKNQREYSRTGTMPTAQPSLKPTIIPLPASSTVTRHVSLSPTQNLIRLSQNVVPRNQMGIRPCSSAIRGPPQPNVTARSRVKQPIPPNHLQNRPVQSLNSVRNNVIQKDRTSSIGKLRSRVAPSGNNIKVGVYTSVQISQSPHHSCPIVLPAINRDLYSQHRCEYQANVTDLCSAVPGSQRQATADLDRDPQPVTVEQQPRSNEVLQNKLSEVESWLMENSNQTGLVSSLPESVGQEQVSSLTFDFETFLND